VPPHRRSPTSIDGQIVGQVAAEYGTILTIDRYLDLATGA
jgi:hypothetical protein